MSVAYDVLYRIGFTPWDELADLPVLNRQVAALLDREERERPHPPGRALDLGCGRGHWSVELAKRGWQVTGVDCVAAALRRARERADREGVEVRLVKGDVTRLTGAGVGNRFDLLLDFGLFHDELTDDQRAAMGREVSAVAATGATLLMMAWSPRRRFLLPRGAGRSDVEAAYRAWTVIGEERFDVSAAPFYRRVKHPDPRFYRLRRA